MLTKSNAKVALARARLQAARMWPYSSFAIMSLTPIERNGLGTCAVDSRFRLYYDPAFIESVTPKEAAAIMLHEVAHLLLKHHKRAGNLVPADNAKAWENWNIAADIAVNWLLPDHGGSLPEGSVTHDQFDFAPGLSAEQYYHLLNKKAEAEDEARDNSSDSGGANETPGVEDASNRSEDGGCDGSPCGGPDHGEEQAPEGGDRSGCGDDEGNQEQPGDNAEQSAGDSDCNSNTERRDNHPGRTDDIPAGNARGGSCSDGQQRPWELDQEDSQNCEVPGLEDHEQDQIVKQVAERAEKEQGYGRGNSQAFIDAVLNPKVNPRRLLMRAVQAHTENIVSGSGGRYTYRRPARRPGIGGTIRPRSFRCVPRILVLIDTSGSMSRTDLGLSVGLVGKVLSGLNLRDGVRVIAGDTYPQSDAKIFDPSKVELCGGGGTEMDALIEYAAELPKSERPELCIVCTDGYTGWPKESPGFPVVACLTGDPGSCQVPDWIDRVDLY